MLKQVQPVTETHSSLLKKDVQVLDQEQQTLRQSTIDSAAALDCG